MMTLLLVVIAALVLGGLVMVGIVIQVLRMAPTPLVAQAAPAPVVLPPPALTRPVPPPEPSVRIRYELANGHRAGEESIPQRTRRSTRIWRHGVFSASHRSPDGAWVYRFVHDE